MSQIERSHILKKIILVLFCTLILLPSLVHAHTSLSSSNPAEGQVVTEDLEQIILTFGTPIEVLSTMDLVKDGNVIPLEDIKVDNKQLMGTIAKPLENGTYIIQWKIVGEDGHPIKGEINFVVEMAQNGAEPTPDQPDTPEKTEANKEDINEPNQSEPKKDEQNIASDTSEENDEQNNNSMLITVFIILIVIFGIVLLMFTRKKR
jgi:copper resistance protein C